MKYGSIGLLMAVALTGFINGAAARPNLSPVNWDDIIVAQNDARAGRRIGMGEATEIVRRQTGGRVLNAQDVRQGGRDGYRVKVLIGSSEVRIFFVDARSGAVQQD